MRIFLLIFIFQWKLIKNNFDINHPIISILLRKSPKPLNNYTFISFYVFLRVESSWTSSKTLKQKLKKIIIIFQQKEI